MSSTTLVPFTKTTTGLDTLGADGAPVVPSSAALRDALATASRPHDDVDGLRELKTRLTNELGETLQVETKLRQRLKAEIDEVESAIVAARVNDGRDMAFSYLDFEVLRWRHPKQTQKVPVPRFALVDVMNTGVTFLVQSNDYLAWVKHPTYNCFLDRYYADVMGALHRKGESHRSMARLSFGFEAVIPAEARALIKQAQSAFPAVFLLVDTPKDAWGYNETRVPFLERHDPLILGLGGDKLWVLGAFDATAIEEYIQTEFTTKA